MKTKQRLIASVLLLVTLCLLFACGDKGKAGAPANVAYDGERITWDAVEGVESYSVSINGGDAMKVKTNSFAYKLPAGTTTFTVSITAEGKYGKGSKKSTTTVEFQPLDSITEIRISDTGELSWAAVDLATGYKIQVDGTEVATVTDASFDGLTAGMHTVKVRAIVEDNPSYYSCWSPAAKLTILSPVDQEQIVYENGYIKWVGVAGAVGYELSINGRVVEREYAGTSYEYDALREDFSVCLRALGNHSDTYDSARSGDRSFTYLFPAENLNVVDGILCWDKVKGADSYIIRINGVTGPTVNTNAYDQLKVNVTNEVEILPTSTTAATFSDWSQKLTVCLLAAPTLRWVDGLETDDGTPRNTVVWDNIRDAADYSVRLTDPSGKQTVLMVTEPSFAEAYLLAGTYTVEVQSMPVSGNTHSYASAYSKPIKITRLAAPTLAKEGSIVSNDANLAEGFTVTFNPVAGASGYTLYKDQNSLVERSTKTYIKVTDLSANASIEEQTHNFSLRSMGSVRTVNGITEVALNSLSDEATNFVVTVLAAPIDPAMDGYSVVFSAVNRAEGYAVRVGSSVYKTPTTSYDLRSLDSGNYEVSVCAQGDGASILPSPYTPVIHICRLESPKNLRIGTAGASEGTMTFDTVAHASGYEVVFNDNGVSIPVGDVENINQYITEEGTTVYLLSIANAYNADKTMYYMTSPPGKTSVFVKLAAPTFGDVAFSDTQLIWREPANVNKATYTPTYEVYAANDIAYNGEKNGTSMDITDLACGDSYTFYVKAIGDGTNYINSEKSAVVTIYRLGIPEVRRDDGAYKWQSVTNASSYAVYIDGKLEETVKHTPGTENAYVPEFSELKTYNVEIFAIGDGGISTIKSEPAVIRQETKQLTTPNFTISYTETSVSKTGQVKLDITTESKNARGYTYTVGGVSKVSHELSYLHSTNSVGNIICSVYANGGNFDDRGVYWLDSQTVGGNNRYAITLLASPNSAEFKLNADGLLSWSAVSGTSTYEVELYINGAKTPKVVTATKVSLEIADFAKVDQLTVRIRAIGNGDGTITSEWSERTWDNV